MFLVLTTALFQLQSNFLKDIFGCAQLVLYIVLNKNIMHRDRDIELRSNMTRKNDLFFKRLYL